MTQLLCVRDVISKLPQTAGVYLFKNKKLEVIYVGKAKHLKNRVKSYFYNHHTNPKTKQLVSMIANIDTIQTQDEYAALVLENELIKQYRPKYNIALKDDKSFPFLVTNPSHPFPRIDYHRGAKKSSLAYYGPYTDVTAIKAMLNELQKLFKIRQCHDHIFQSRTRPCIQYQLNRCTAPCVGKITREEYSTQVKNAHDFLMGNSEEFLARCQGLMLSHSGEKSYEKAAYYRDLIKQYHEISNKSSTHLKSCKLDVFVMLTTGDICHILVLPIRDGHPKGKSFFSITNNLETPLPEILRSFICQYYTVMKLAYGPPNSIISNIEIADFKECSYILKQLYNLNVKIKSNNTKSAKTWQDIAMQNLKQELKIKKQHNSSVLVSNKILVKALNLTVTPKWIDCFDISHTSGHATIASCVVFDENGAVKSKYRAFNIPPEGMPDDYKALAYAVEKKYSKQCVDFPDLIIIDGGKGQLSCVNKALKALNINNIPLLAMAKGPHRTAGQEIFHTLRQHDIKLNEHDAAFHLLQYIRNEAHRFAVLKHRKKRDKASLNFIIESIPGVGRQTRLALYNHFGGLEGVKKARLDQLIQVKGVNRKLGARIIQFFNDGILS